jgi:DNA polymerase (family 10)
VLPHKRFLGTIKAPAGAKVRSGGSRRLALTVDGRKVDVFVALREEKPFALLQYVNSRFKNIAMRKRAQVLGLKLNQFGLFRSGKKLSIRSQDQVLRMLGMSAITTK